MKIAVLPDTPPPPPPPKEEKRPEPKPDENKPQPQEQKAVEAPPEAQQLKMEGAAGDGPSAFGAGSVTKEYEKGEIGGGSGTAVNKMQFALFTSQLQKHISASLAKDLSIKLGDYRVRVNVQLEPSGAFKHVSLEGSSGDPKLDRALEAALMRLPPMKDVPSNLPQPISLRITNRMTG